MTFGGKIMTVILTEKMMLGKFGKCHGNEEVDLLIRYNNVNGIFYMVTRVVRKI